MIHKPGQGTQDGSPSVAVAVAVDDRRSRRAAGRTVFKAYLTAAQAWLFSLGAAVLFMASNRLVQGAWPSHVAAAIDFVVYLCIGAVGYAATMGSVIYRAPRSPRYELWFVDTGVAAAALVLRADPRRGALPGDLQACCAGAWPRRRGAGRRLGEWVREDVHARGGRVTLTAVPCLAHMYRSAGCVDDGRSAGLLRRFATKPRPEEPR